MVVTAAGEEITAVNAAVGLKQTATDFMWCGIHRLMAKPLSLTSRTATAYCKKSSKELNHKVIVFVPFKHTIEVLEERAHRRRYQREVISGEVSAGNRTKDYFTTFKTPQTSEVLIVQPQAAAHGVTLTAADTIVWWGPTPSHEIYAQANARAHRAGQTNKVTVVRLVRQ